MSITKIVSTKEEAILSLAHKWEGIARRKFQCATKQSDDPTDRPPGKRFIEHGAMCYFNCAQELRKVLSSFSLPSSTKQE